MTDADVLRDAAEILRRESSRPRSMMLAAICNTLTDLAGTLEARAALGRVMFREDDDLTGPWV